MACAGLGGRGDWLQSDGKTTGAVLRHQVLDVGVGAWWFGARVERMSGRAGEQDAVGGSGGELLHVGAELSQQVLRRAAPDAGDGVQERHLLLKRGQTPRHLRIEVADEGLESVQVRQVACHEEAVVLPKASRQGALQLR